jgi:hypothetical protein
MKTKLILLALALFTTVIANAEKKENKPAKTSPSCSATTQAETHIIVSGIIVDGETGETLTGVEVTLEGCEQKTYTDFEGKFSFEGLTPGNYKVTTNLISYNKGTTTVINVNNNQVHALNMQLFSESTQVLSNQPKTNYVATK